MAHFDLKISNAKGSQFALYSPPFRFYMGGSLIASVGEWMDMVALNWAVLQLTNSPLHLALINACRLVPIFVLSFPAGMLADRYNRRKLLILIQLGVTLLTFALGALLLQGAGFWLFAAVVTLRSILMAMDPPVRNSMIPNLVQPEGLTSAIAWNTTMLNLSRIVGPAVAGAMLVAMPANGIFWISGWGFLVEVLCLSFIRMQTGTGTARQRPRPKKVKGDLREALLYIRRHPNAQSLLLLAVVPMVFGFPYTSMMPLFAKELLGLGPDGFGALLSVSAIGALVGSLFLSVAANRLGAGKWLISSLIVFGLCLLGFMLMHDFLWAAVMMFGVGLASQTYRTLSRMTIQLQVPDHLRGRIMSIALMDRGFIPLGALLIGVLATSAGTLAAGVTMGAGCVVITLAVLVLRRQIWDV
jgi:MFS transporter, DHA1 family, staphyloferrin A biosynthesis exporter